MKTILFLLLSLFSTFCYPQGGAWQIGVSSSSTAVTEPTTQASSVNFTSVSYTSFTANWTNGNGSDRIVLIHQGAAVDSNPVDLNTYTANPAYASGSEIGTGNYVIYKGTGTSVNVTELTAGVTWHVRVYEFNGSGGTENYYTSTATGNPNSQATTAFFDALYNFGGVGTDPAVAGSISVWDLTKSTTTNETYVVGPSGVSIIAVNGSGGGPPTLSTGQYWGFKSGSTDKAFSMTVTGTNSLHNSIWNCSWFLDSSPAGLRLTGLPDGTYTIKIYSLISGDATTRTGQWSVNGGSTVNVQSNNSGTNSIIPDETTHTAIFTGVTTSSGVIYILGSVVTGQYPHLNALRVTQTGS